MKNKVQFLNEKVPKIIKSLKNPNTKVQQGFQLEYCGFQVGKRSIDHLCNDYMLINIRSSPPLCPTLLGIQPIPCKCRPANQVYLILAHLLDLWSIGIESSKCKTCLLNHWIFASDFQNHLLNTFLCNLKKSAKT